MDAINSKNYVSLLPEGYVKSRRDAGLTRRLTIILSIIAAVLLVLTAITFMLRYANGITAKSLADENAKVEQQIGQIAQYEQQNNELRALRDKIVVVQEQDPLLLYAVADIIGAMPKNINLASIETSVTEEGEPICTLQCEGARYEDISTAISGISKILKVKSVECTASSATSDRVRFTLVAKLEFKEE